MELKDKIIWITGASSGIGRSVALLMGERGARIILSGRDLKRLEEVRRTMPQPDKAVILPLDLNDPDSLPGIVQKALDCFGSVVETYSTLYGFFRMPVA